ncbi:MAG: hypothetical protein EOO01_06200 [Chitinophagaceae bacterium]|nr:MAG: hypothetical protein EOO01_06200 [Chitinophagaceae bacterium]
MKKLLLLVVILTSITNLFAQVAVPVVKSFSPLRGPIGTMVTISGTNFDTLAANNIVHFGSSRAVVIAATASQLTVKVPIGTTYNPISVLNTVTHRIAWSGKPFNVTYAGPPELKVTDFAQKGELVGNRPSRALTMADLNGDNRAELIVTNKDKISIFPNISATSAYPYNQKIDFPGHGESYIVLTADMDNDGKLDIITSNNLDNSISVYLNRTTGSVINASSFAEINIKPGISITGIAVGDLDRDGKLDLIVQNYEPTVSIYKNLYAFLSCTFNKIFMASSSLPSRSTNGRMKSLS